LIRPCARWLAWAWSTPYLVYSHQKRNPLLPAYVAKAIRAIEEVLDDDEDR
jgi:hypothetical protein